MPLAHRLKASSCSPVNRVVNGPSDCDSLVMGTVFSAWGRVIFGLSSPAVRIMPRGIGSQDGRRTGGGFWGTNELLSTGALLLDWRGDVEQAVATFLARSARRHSTARRMCVTQHGDPVADCVERLYDYEPSGTWFLAQAAEPKRLSRGGNASCCYQSQKTSV
jgi:hypothetical protein